MMVLRPTTLDLPDDIAAGVGRLMAHWSYQTFLLAKVTYTILGVSPKQARVAVRDPRPEDYVTMIEELMGLAGLTTSVSMKALKSGLKELKSLRDTIAHGLWLRNTETDALHIQMIAGSWQPDSKARKSVSRRVSPEGRPVTVAGLETMRQGTVVTINQTTKLLEEIEEQIAAMRK
jgi:hypothetical protein